MENLIGAEKVLYKATYEFYLNVVKVSQEDAENQAKLKIEKKKSWLKFYQEFNYIKIQIFG